jgi:hypothetical protein
LLAWGLRAQCNAPDHPGASLLCEWEIQRTLLAKQDGTTAPTLRQRNTVPVPSRNDAQGLQAIFALHLEGEMAEAVRFELTDGCPSPVFKTGAIDHSATLPGGWILRALSA